MALWSIKPEYKKSLIEKNYLYKDGNTIVIETGWRGGEFHVETDDDKVPNLKSDIDLYSQGYELEMIECWDGCWEDHDYDDCNDDVAAEVEEFLEDNSWLDLLDNGWESSGCEFIISGCEVLIEEVKDAE